MDVAQMLLLQPSNASAECFFHFTIPTMLFTCNGIPTEEQILFFILLSHFLLFFSMCFYYCCDYYHNHSVQERYRCSSPMNIMILPSYSVLIMLSSLKPYRFTNFFLLQLFVVVSCLLMFNCSFITIKSLSQVSVETQIII